MGFDVSAEKSRIKKEILELEHQLRKLREIDNSHLDFSRLNKISRYGFASLSIDFRKIATAIHFLEFNGKNVCGEELIGITKYREVKMRELTTEQIQESNELLQKMLEPFAQKMEEKIKELKEKQNG